MNRIVPTLLLLAAILHPLATAHAQGTAFTYQGRLDDGGSQANGSYDLTFALFDAVSGGVQQGTTLTNAAIAVSNGLFTVTLDFGNQFPGPDRWLEIGVRPNGGGTFSMLAPRQPLTPTPYAVRAANFSGPIAAAQLSGTYTGAVTFNNPSNSFSGNGGSLTGLSATALSSGTVPSVALSNAWRIAGNAGTVNGTHFVGTTDNQALDFRVFSQRGLRLQPNTNGTPTIIGGSLSNVVSANTPGVTIAGGDRNTIFSISGLGVEFTSAYAVIGGGSSNSIDMTSANSVIGGGFQNSISGNDYFSTIGGGHQNLILNTSAYATIGGGQGNAVGLVSPYATIGGGAANTIEYFTLYSVIAGGRNNVIRSNAQHSVISGGRNNDIQTNAEYATIAGGELNRVERDAIHAFIGGGRLNSTRAGFSTIIGGLGNQIEELADRSAIGGGSGNSIRSNAQYAVIAGGQQNTISTSASYSMVGGGSQNNIFSNAQYAVLAGGRFNIISTNASYSVIGGGLENTNNAQYAVVAGGRGNAVSTEAVYSVVGGGIANGIQSNATFSVIAGGNFNHIRDNASESAISGGNNNSIGDGCSFSTIGGGVNNQIANSAVFATIPGGYDNTASGQNSLAAGQRAGALHNGSFVWADTSTPAGFNSTSSNQFLIRASGGVGIGTTAPIYPLHIAAADPVVVLQDTGDNSTQVGYVSYRNGSLTETAWVGYGSPGSPDFSIVNARSGGDIVLFPILGNVGISRTPATNRLEVEGNASKTTAGSWLANSDARIKTGVRTVTGALDKLSQVRLVEFHYTDEYRAQHPSLKDRSYLNVVAQEFQKVFPDDVQSSGEKLSNGDAILQVDTYPLTIYSAAAIQELNQRLTRELKSRDAENAELKQRLEKLEQLINAKEKSL